MDVLYDKIGKDYSIGRKTDPEIAANIFQYLDEAESIVNIGAGTGSYEPDNKNLIAVEPSEEMIKQRLKSSYPLIREVAGIVPVGIAVQDGNYEDKNLKTGEHITIPALIKFAPEYLKLITSSGALNSHTIPSN